MASPGASTGPDASGRPDGCGPVPPGGAFGGEAQYRALVETTGMGYVLLDGQGTVLEANETYLRLAGRPDVLGRHVCEWTAPHDRERNREEVGRCLGTGAVRDVEVDYVDSCGRLTPVQIHATLLATDQGPRIVSLVKDISAERRREAALRDQERLGRDSQEAASIGSYKADFTVGRWESSAVLDRIFGIGPDHPRDVEGWLTLLHEEDREAMGRYLLEDVGVHGQDFQREYRIRRQTDGEVRWVLGLGRPTFDAQGRFATLVGTIQDITERKGMEEALRESEERHRSLFESSLAPMLVLDPSDGAILDANPAAEAFYGWTRLELLAKRIFELNSLPEGAVRLEVARVARGEQQRFEFRHRAADGSLRDVEVFCSPIPSRGSLHLFSIIYDVTERKRAERELRATEERFFRVFHLSPLVVILSRLEDGSILEVNGQFTRVLGYEPEAVRGRRSTDIGLLSPEERARLQAQLVDDKDLRGVECVFRTREGGEVPCLLFAGVIREEEEALVLSMVVDLRDSKAAEGERRRLEHQLHHAQKLESLGSLAGGVAHDMNNVLGAILSMASLQMEQAEANPSLRRSMELIVRACERGGALVKGLLGFARQRVAEERTVDLNHLVREEAGLLSRTTLSRVVLELDLAEGLPPVLGDPAALSHALLNLCVNAVDAMPEGGRLTLRTINLQDGRVRLEVEDTGHGMAGEVLDKALDPFFTTKPQGKGTGLGLSIVYGTVKAHRGDLALRSEPGRGTTVEITLPACQEPGDLWEAFEAPLAAPALQVLLVDDDELILESTSELLLGLGHACTLATRGEEAIRRLEEGLAPQAVILDLNMPGMGGAAALHRIRALRPDLPVLLATGRVEQQALDLLAQAGHARLMAKPFSLADLRRNLAALP